MSKASDKQALKEAKKAADRIARVRAAEEKKAQTLVPARAIERSHEAATVSKHRHYTPIETRAHVQMVEQLISAAASRAQIERAMIERFGCSRNRVGRIIDRVFAAWEAEDADSGARNRAAASRRIRGYIRQAQGVRDPQTGAWKERPNFIALKGFEELLSKIEGTQAPVKIDIDIRSSVAVREVMTNLTPAQVSEHLQRFRQMELESRAYKALTEAADGTIVEGKH